MVAAAKLDAAKMNVYHYKEMRELDK
jgi:hypothetical protein